MFTYEARDEPIDAKSTRRAKSLPARGCAADVSEERPACNR
jgi:hypothetical protein